MKKIFVLLVLLPQMALSASVCAEKERVIYFNMPLLLGNKIFNDQVEICRKSDGSHYGQLEVPKRFKAPLENIRFQGDRLSFSITADEGRGKFTVLYEGQLKNDRQVFLGVAKLKSGGTLGPFIGVSKEEKISFELIQ